MKKYLYPLVSIPVMMFATSTYAQSGGLEGFSVNAGVSTVTSSVKLSAGEQSADGIGRSSYAVDIGADYGFRFADRAVVLVGAAYGLANPTIFKDEVLGLPAEIKFNRRWSVSVAPGISFGDSGLMYAKLAYISGKPGSDAFEGQTHSGYGYGVGARFMLNQNVYVNVEVMQNDYETKTYNDLGLDVSAENTTGMLSLGYSF